MKTANLEPSIMRSMSDAFESAEALAAPAVPASAAWLEAGTAIVTLTGRIIEANAGLAGWLGATPAALKACGLPELLGARQADYEEDGKNRFQRAHVFSKPDWGQKPGVGVVVWLKRADKLPWRDFFHKGFFATCADSSKCINIGDWRN